MVGGSPSRSGYIAVPGNLVAYVHSVGRRYMERLGKRMSRSRVRGVVQCNESSVSSRCFTVVGTRVRSFISGMCGSVHRFKCGLGAAPVMFIKNKTIIVGGFNDRSTEGVSCGLSMGTGTEKCRRLTAVKLGDAGQLSWKNE